MERQLQIQNLNVSQYKFVDKILTPIYEIVIHFKVLNV